MLEIIEYDKDEYVNPCLLVLGCFDAVHAGHKELLKKAKLQAKINGLDLGVMTFCYGKGGKQVYTFEERLNLFEQFNAKFVFKINFDEQFKKTKPLDFLSTIENKLNIKAYMSGKDFRFGEKAKGKSSTLKNYAEDEENGVWYMPVKDVLQDGEKISTTQIKIFLQEGDIIKANGLLGANFFVTGKVISGMGRGSSLGYPTVNLEYPAEKVEIKQGVYKVKSSIDGVEFNGVANYGARPTFGEVEPVLEVYFEDFEGDLYGKTLKVEFVEYLRDIQKFESADELISQLDKDVESIAETEKLPTDLPEHAVIEETAEQFVEESAYQTVEEVPEESVEEIQNEISICEKCGESCCTCDETDDAQEDENVKNQCCECECNQFCNCDCSYDCDECPCEDDCETCECEKACEGCEGCNSETDERFGRRDNTCRGDVRGRNGD